MTAVASKATRKSYRTLMQAANTSRLESSWTTQPESADSIIFKNLRTLVARSRHELMDGDYVKNFARIVKKNIVGARGFRLKSTPRNERGQVDVLAKDAIEEAWRKQSKLGNWEITGTMSRATFEQLLISTVAIDGEAFVVIVRGADAGPTGFSLQMIDSMRIDPAHNDKMTGDRFIRAGIEYNAFGKPVAYHIAEDNSEIYHTGYSTSRRRVPAEDVIHVYIPELAGQRRGLPWMHTALWRLRNVKGFEDAAVVNARVGASKMGLFSDKDDQDRDDEEEPQDIEIDAEPGTFHNIGNRDFHAFNPQFPDQSMESFIKVQLRGVAAGLGVAYHSLANDLSSVNFSSIRAGTLDERDTWKMLQEWMISAFETRAFEAWIRFSVLSGTITVRNKPLRMDRLEKYLSAEFRGRRWPWVDPLKEIAAAEKAVNARLTSRTKVMEDMHDEDSWDVLEEIAREEKDMRDLGIEIPTLPGASTLSGGKPAKDADDEDEDDTDD
jgi:lambda family phage portal protein